MLAADGRFKFVPAHAELRISAWADGIPAAFREHDVRFVRLHASATNALEPLAELAPRITRLSIEGQPEDAGLVGAFSSLKELAIPGPVDAVDFAALPQLEKVLLTLDKPQFGNLSAAPSLKHLTINGGDVRDLSAFLDMHGLEHLSLGGSPLRSLAGVGQLPKLKELAIDAVPLEDLAGLEKASGLEWLSLDSMPKLKSIRQVGSLRKLRELRLSQIRNLEDVDVIASCTALENLQLSLKAIPAGATLARLKTLKYLALISDQPIPDLQFISAMPSLVGLVLEKTVVEDGDMSVLKNHSSLQRAVYMDRKHYRPRRKDVIDAKGMVIHS